MVEIVRQPLDAVYCHNHLTNFLIEIDEDLAEFTEELELQIGELFEDSKYEINQEKKKVNVNFNDGTEIKITFHTYL